VVLKCHEICFLRTHFHLSLLLERDCHHLKFIVLRKSDLKFEADIHILKGFLRRGAFETKNLNTYLQTYFQYDFLKYYEISELLNSKS